MRDVQWARLAFLTLFILYGHPAFTTTRICADDVSVDVRVACQIESGSSALLEITVTNSSDRNIFLSPNEQPWESYLNFATRSLDLYRVKGRESVTVGKRPVPKTGGNLQKMACIKPNMGYTYVFQLRQIFQFPNPEEGEYKIDFSCDGITATASFSIIAGLGKRSRLATFDCALAEYLYHEEDSPPPVQLMVDVIEHEGKSTLIARNTYRYSIGSVVLATGGKELLAYESSLALQRRIRMYREGEPGSELPIVREYIGIAWIDAGRLKYTTYGIYFYGVSEQTRRRSSEKGIAPDYCQLVQVKNLPIDDQVERINNVSSENGYIKIIYQTDKMLEKTLHVDDLGNLIKVEKGGKKEKGD